MLYESTVVVTSTTTKAPTSNNYVKFLVCIRRKFAEGFKKKLQTARKNVGIRDVVVRVVDVDAEVFVEHPSAARANQPRQKWHCKKSSRVKKVIFCHFSHFFATEIKLVAHMIVL